MFCSFAMSTVCHITAIKENELIQRYHYPENKLILIDMVQYFVFSSLLDIENIKNTR